MKLDDRFKPELCVSTDDTRYSLHRPYFDAERRVVVATDGHMLVVVPAEAEKGDAAGFCAPQDLRIARGEESVKDAKWWKSEAKFPNYAQVIPDFKPGDPGTVTVALSAKYLSAIAEALGADHGNVVLTIRHKKAEATFDPVLVRACLPRRLSGRPEADSGALAALMPVRIDLASEQARPIAVQPASEPPAASGAPGAEASEG